MFILTRRSKERVRGSACKISVLNAHFPGETARNNRPIYERVEPSEDAERIGKTQAVDHLARIGGHLPLRNVV